MRILLRSPAFAVAGVINPPWIEGRENDQGIMEETIEPTPPGDEQDAPSMTNTAPVKAVKIEIKPLFHMKITF